MTYQRIVICRWAPEAMTDNPLLPAARLPLPDPQAIVRAHNLHGLAAAFQFMDLVTRDGVIVQIGQSGRASIIGSGELLNWFCDQVPHFRGILGDSLPDGRYIYVPSQEANGKTFSTIGAPEHVSLPATNIVG